MSEYYTLQGHKAVPSSEWPTLSADQKRVAADNVGEAWVSTVFLVLNHSWIVDGPPLIFETMVFDGPHDGFCDRYSTWDEAAAGHARVVANLQNHVAPDATDAEGL